MRLPDPQVGKIVLGRIFQHFAERDPERPEEFTLGSFLTVDSGDLLDSSDPPSVDLSYCRCELLHAGLDSHPLLPGACRRLAETQRLNVPWIGIAQHSGGAGA